MDRKINFSELAIDHEVLLLSNLCFDCHQIAKCSELEPEDFKIAEWGLVFKRCRELYLGGMQFTIWDLTSRFPELGTETEVRKLFFNLNKMCVAELYPTEDLVRAIKYNSAKTKFSHALESAKTDLEKKSIEPVLSDLYEQIISLENENNNEGIQSAYDVTGDIIESFKHEPKIYPTGLSQLDTAMAGGVYAGKAYGFAARKKVGKTALLATFAQNFNKAGVTTLYLALEMGREQIMHRIIAREIEEHDIRFISAGKNDYFFQEKVLRFRENNPRNLFFVDKAGISFSNLKKELSFQFQKRKPQVIIIDYWQLIKGKNDKTNAAEHLDDVAQWMAEFAKKHDVAIICASQINQEGNTRGGEGMRLAFDQVYQMQKVGEDRSGELWMEMMDTRYTAWMNLGDAHTPAFILNPKGVWVEEI